MEKRAPVSSGTATFWLIVTTFLWGGSFVFNKIGFRDIPPVTFLFLRFALATLFMALFSLKRLRGLDPRIIRKGVLVGCALASANLSFVMGVSGTSVTRAGFLNNLFVLIVPLLCYLLWRDKVDRLTGVGICLATGGLALLAGGTGFSRGDLFSTVCALFIAIHIITVSKVLKNEDVYLVSLVQFATVTVIGAVLTALLPHRPITVGTAAAGALLYCAIFPTVICFTLQNTYQRYTTPTRACLIYTLDPVWSMLGGYVILGERLNMWEGLGCLLIFAAVAVPLAIRVVLERRGHKKYDVEEGMEKRLEEGAPAGQEGLGAPPG
ncbi:DMT family transporter [Geomonas sp. RF6]|uniref:DMT family transporter n=1 Tax=Geomonas sp. RF6 TaxID=2897342 RepID=UPI001E4068A1|nr:DMT family transporter [Geomonas sp. RF6]UFS68530.1 DMT family transporter [Geomonas sp. RF6]